MQTRVSMMTTVNDRTEKRLEAFVVEVLRHRLFSRYGSKQIAEFCFLRAWSPAKIVLDFEAMSAMNVLR